MLQASRQMPVDWNWSRIPRASFCTTHQVPKGAQALPFSLVMGDRQRFEKESSHPFLTKDHCGLG
jgi:hypothetical protein